MGCEESYANVEDVIKIIPSNNSLQRMVYSPR
jgi:hypothetical protein